MFHRSEKFLSLDIRPDRTSGLFFEMTGDRTIRAEKFEEHIDFAKLLKAPSHRAAHASWEGRYFFSGRRKIIAAADASLTTTIPVPFTYRRETERRGRPLSIDELEDQIAQAMPGVLTQCRAEVARRLNIESIEAVLVGARAAHIMIDGKPTAHPAGFLGKEVGVALELTFVRRDIFEAFRTLFNAPEPFFFFELPQAVTQLLSRVRPLPVNLMVPDGEGSEGGLFVLQSADRDLPIPVLYREKFPWAFDALWQAIEETYSVSRPVAHDMYRAFVSRDLSPAALRHIGAIIAPFSAAFLALVQKAKLHGTAFCLAPYPLPFAVPHREGSTVIEEIPLAEILRKFDITLVPGPLAGRPDILLRNLAPFLLMYFDRTQGALNERLRRKVHWLMN